MIKMGEATKNDGHKVYIDVIRVIATILVLFNHLPVYKLYMETTGIMQWAYLCLTAFIRCNVPLFFMISGTLLLQKGEAYTKTLRRRVIRMMVVLPMFEYLVYAATAVSNHVIEDCFNVGFWNFFKMCLAGNVYGTYSYWYLYAYIGMLLLLPFLEMLARNMHKREAYILVLVHFLMNTAIPVFNLILSVSTGEGIEISPWFSVSPAIESAFFFPIMGYYIDHNVDIVKLKIRFCIIGMGISILGAAAATYIEGRYFGYSENYVGIFDYVIAFSMFLLIKECALSHGSQLRIVSRIAKLCFGVYLLDPVWKVLIFEKYRSYRNIYFRWLDLSIGWCLISFVLGMGVTAILKRIPGIKKIL